ncbi:uncharacterized [Tachysurus ichikawai]
MMMCTSSALPRHPSHLFPLRSAHALYNTGCGVLQKRSQRTEVLQFILIFSSSHRKPRPFLRALRLVSLKEF